MKNLPARFSQLGAIGFAISVFVAPAFAQNSTALSGDVSQDVLKSYRLLVQTPYKQIDPQALLDAARSAMLAEAKKHGVRVTLPDVQASDDDEQSAAALDQEIETAAAAAHASPTDYAYVAMKGMADAVGDKWTVFMDPAAYRKFNDVLDPEKISGIGVVVDTDPTTKFVRASYVVPGTPADRAGIVNGDLFRSVDGTSTKGMTQDAVSKLLRGKSGTVVHIVLAKSSDDAGHDVAITRTEVTPPTVIGKMLPGGTVGYIYVVAFGKDTPDEFNTALQRVKAAGARALVLDLRDDGGGYVQSALEISSRFVLNTPLVTVEERGSADQTLDSRAADAIDSGNSDDPSPDLPVVALPTMVLVNDGTASASEITAGALQDDGIGTLVGTKTYGKGVMQTLTPLPDGSAIKITTAHYLTPAHHDINLRGIEPNVRVDENKNDRLGELATDSQLRAAVELLEKKVADIKG
jgi:carboxyl-terminal processing protease